MKKKLKLIVAGGAGLALLGGVPLALMFRGETIKDREAREFQDLLGRLMSPVLSVAAQAALSIPAEAELLKEPERLMQAIAAYSGERLRSLKGEERLGVARSFWRGVLLLGRPESLRLVSNELAPLRHSLLLERAQREHPEEVAELADGQTGPWMRGIMEDLVKDLFRPPAPDSERLGPLLWDRANLEEMAGLGAEAWQSYRLLSYERVRDHWEFDSRISYYVAKADLLGRIRRLVIASGEKEIREDAMSLAADGELTELRTEENGALGHLLDGIDLLHRGDPDSAVEALARYQESYSQGERSPLEAPLLVGSRTRQLSVLLGAIARTETARSAFREAQEISVARAASTTAARRALELRRARLIAGLSLREEFEPLAHELGRNDPASAELLARTADIAWGDKERGTARLREIIKARDDLPDAAGWAEFAAGRLPPGPRALFEVGQICDELGDLARLERIVSHLQFAFETEADEAYLAFLRGVLLLRRGQVVESWNELERLLDRRTFPPGLSRRTIARFMEGAQSAADRLTRARRLLDEAERSLSALRSLRQEIDAALAARASLRQWIALTQGESVDPARFAPRREAAGEILAAVRAGFAALDRLSYPLDRCWVQLRNSMGRTFLDLSKSRQFDEALARLIELDTLVGGGARGRLAREEAELRMQRAERVEATRSRREALDDYREAGRLFLLVSVQVAEQGGDTAIPGEDARRQAAQAFERAGDWEGVISAIAPIETTTRAASLLATYARACLSNGRLWRARDVLGRAIALGEENLGVVEEPGDPINLGGYHYRDPPRDLTAWLDLHPFVDPLNGIGFGKLRYHPARRTLQWKAPSDTKFGVPVYLTSQEMVRLPSGDDPRKTILVAPSPGEGTSGTKFPPEKGEWELEVAHRELPVDQVQLDSRLGLAEVNFRLARLVDFSDINDVTAFAERHLSGGGNPRARLAMTQMVESSLEALYKDDASRETLRAHLERALRMWQSRVDEEAQPLGDSSGERKEWLRKLSTTLGELAAASKDPVKVREGLRSDIPQVHDRLKSFYVSALRLLVGKEGPKGLVRQTIEELSREILDREASEALLFLCETVGNRGAVWRRAMYIRALQLERRAAETQPPRGDRSVLGPPPEPAVLLASARDIYERLLYASTLADGAEWIGRAHLALGRLETRAGRLPEARRWLDLLADADLEALGRLLIPSVRAELLELTRTAAFARADLARRMGDLNKAVRYYAQAVQRYQGSALVLWGYLQLGSCYEALGLAEDASREYEKGKAALRNGVVAANDLSHWLGGDRRELTASIREAFGGREGDQAMASLSAPDAGTGDRDFWERIFDEKLRGLARRQ